MILINNRFYNTNNNRFVAVFSTFGTFCETIGRIACISIQSVKRKKKVRLMKTDRVHIFLPC